MRKISLRANILRALQAKPFRTSRKPESREGSGKHGQAYTQAPDRAGPAEERPTVPLRG